jgi:hypothetical protein
LSGHSFKASIGNTNVFGLCLPEEVVDGARNEWLHQIALFYKWHVISEEECLRKIELRMKFIPDIANSRNGRNITSIVRSIYRNHTAHFGKYADFGLPEWMTDDDRYKSHSVPTLRLVKPLDEQDFTRSERPLKLETNPQTEHHDHPPKVKAAIVSQESTTGTMVGEGPTAPSKRQFGPVLSFSQQPQENETTSGACVSQPFEATRFLESSGKGFQNVVSLQKGFYPIKGSLRFLRFVGDDAHVSFRGVRYSVSQEYVGECVGVFRDDSQSKVFIFYQDDLIETHDVSNTSSRRVTKLEHQYYPQRRKVRADLHALFHGKLYSRGDQYLGQEVTLLSQGDQVIIKDL